MTNFKWGHTYRHKSSLDLDIVVSAEPILKENGVALRVRYYNRFYGIFQPDAATLDSVFVNKHDLANWEDVT